MTMLPKIACPTCGRPTSVGRNVSRLWTHLRDGRRCAGSQSPVDLYGANDAAVTR